MKINSTYVRWGIPTLGVAAALALVAWAGGPQQPTTGKQLAQDTVPAKRGKAIREANEKDLDKEIRQLEQAKENLKDVDWDKIQQSVDDAVKNIDFSKIQEQIDEAMKHVDMEKINRQVEASLKSIDFEKIQEQVNESLKNVDTYIDKEEIKKELDEARKEVEKELKNSKEWKKDWEATKKANKEEIQSALEKSRKEVAKAMEKLDKEKLNWKDKMKDAWEGIDKATEEFKGYQEMIYSMEKEGLLSTKSDYTIKYKDGELTVNGKKQSDEVVSKYKKYFKHDKVTIRKEDGDMDIDTDHKDFD
jgi:chromosome segregation ATPase